MIIPVSSQKDLFDTKYDLSIDIQDSDYTDSDFDFIDDIAET